MQKGRDPGSNPGQGEGPVAQLGRALERGEAFNQVVAGSKECCLGKFVKIPSGPNL